MSKAYNIATSFLAYQNTFTDYPNQLNVAMVTNHNHYTDDMILAANTNATITGPTTVNNITIHGNLIVLDNFNVDGNIEVTGSIRII